MLVAAFVLAACGAPAATATEAPAAATEVPAAPAATEAPAATAAPAGTEAPAATPTEPLYTAPATAAAGQTVITIWHQWSGDYLTAITQVFKITKPLTRM